MTRDLFLSTILQFIYLLTLFFIFIILTLFLAVPTSDINFGGSDTDFVSFHNVFLISDITFESFTLFSAVYISFFWDLNIAVESYDYVFSCFDIVFISFDFVYGSFDINFGCFYSFFCCF